MLTETFKVKKIPIHLLMGEIPMALGFMKLKEEDSRMHIPSSCKGLAVELAMSMIGITKSIGDKSRYELN